jgi:hypothetical protein
MAKNKRSVKNKTRQQLSEKLNTTVLYLYDTGVVHSTIVHSVILLLLAISFPLLTNNRPSPIVISFASFDEETINFETIQPIEIKIPKEPSNDQQETESESFVEDKPNDIIPVSIDDVVVEEDVQNDLIEDLSVEDLSEQFVADISDTEASEKPSVTKEKKIARSEKKTSSNKKGNQPVFGDGNLNANNDQGIGMMKQRLAAYGAKTGDVQISLSWDTIDDIDLHVEVYPIASRINWTRRFGRCGGMLDIDMNAHPSRLSNAPVENIFWEKGLAPYGEYVIGVHNYMNWSRNGATKVNLLITIDGKSKMIPLIVRFGDPVTKVTSFIRENPASTASR